MLYICIFSNKFDLKQTIRVLHTWNARIFFCQNIMEPSMTHLNRKINSGNTKGGSITVTLTSCLTGLKLAVGQMKIFVFICKTD